jgi:hypothetical protein
MFSEISPSFVHTFSVYVDKVPGWKIDNHVQICRTVQYCTCNSVSSDPFTRFTALPFVSRLSPLHLLSRPVRMVPDISPRSPKYSVYLALRDALHGHALPKACVFTLIGWIFELYDLPATWEEDVTFRSDVYAARNLQFAWATMPRTRQEFRAIEQLSCNCVDLGGTALDTHTQGLRRHEGLIQQQPGVAPSSTLLNTAFQPLFFLHANTRHGSKLPRLKKIAKRSRWPLSVQDLMPHGSESTLRGLLGWMELDDNNTFKSAHQGAIFALVHMCHPYILTHLATSRVLLLRGIIQRIDGLHADLLAAVATHGTNLQGFDDTIIKNLMYVGNLLRQLFTLYMNNTQRRVFVSDYGHRLLLACAHGIDACLIVSSNRSKYYTWADLAPINHCLQTFEGAGAKLYDNFPTVQTAQIDEKYMHMFRRAAHSVSAPQFLVWELFLHTMYQLTIRQRCCAPGCAMTVIDGKLRFCAMCLRVPYCSKACQKQAWNLKTGSHRDVCKIIRVLCIQHKLPRNGQIVLQRLNQLLDGMPQDSSYKPMAEAVSKHFASLSELETQTSCK